MGERDFVGGVLFIDGEPLGEVSELLVDLDALTEQNRHRILQGVRKDVQGEIHFKNVSYNRLGMLSLILGRKITNNYLKMHGGVMCRNGGKRKNGKR